MWGESGLVWDMIGDGLERSVRDVEGLSSLGRAIVSNGSEVKPGGVVVSNGKTSSSKMTSLDMKTSWVWKPRSL